MNHCLRPDWPAPPHVFACSTYRHQGKSQEPFHSWNLATHVGDDPEAVADNRKLLTERLALPAEPVWLDQVHGNHIIKLTSPSVDDIPRADGSYSRVTGSVCAVLTADCLPVLITDREGTQVAAVHAGWRGLAAGVIQQAIGLFDCPREEILVWLGPAIGPQAFEVGEEVRSVFVEQLTACETSFIAQGDKKFLANIYQIARQLLESIKVTAVFGGDRCTYSESDAFFSYRRQQQTGRMASLIWMEDQKSPL